MDSSIGTSSRPSEGPSGSRLRIAYVVTRGDEIGGAQIHVRDLATRLRELGQDVHVVTGKSGPLTWQLEARGVTVTLVPTLRRPIRPLVDLHGLRDLYHVLRAIDPDLISTHSSKAGWLGRLAAWRLEKPVLFTAHGWAFTEGVAWLPRQVYRTAERLAGGLATRIITVSEYDRLLAIRSGIAPPDKILRVYNGVLDVPLRRPTPAADAPVRLTMIARYCRQKDHGTLLRALGGLRDANWRLSLVGNGERVADVRRLAVQERIEDRIDFLGTSSQVAEIFAATDVYLLISNWEGFPRSVLEAMRAGVPVIASRVGGTPEAVVDGQTGFLVDRKNVEGLRQLIRRLLHDPTLRQRLGELGRLRYESHFTFERMFERTLQIYAECLPHARFSAVCPAKPEAVAT